MADATSDHQHISLPGGIRMPILGFGTWQLDGQAAYDSVLTALGTGYRHIDTATGYRNEQQVGAALRDSGVPRDEIFLTTKCPPEHAGREQDTIAKSLEDLGVDYVDLWLVHWPPAGEARPETWKEFVRVLGDGRARAIGVSNYDPAQIDELADATGVTPAVNQIPWAPALHDPALLDEHRRRHVALEGYSPFRRSNLDDPILTSVAADHGVTPAQVVLRWHLEHDIVVIPKAAHRERIVSNFDISGFSLSRAEMARIDGLSTLDAHTR
jgi:2,5-diketo-D-gluconate reductase A